MLEPLESTSKTKTKACELGIAARTCNPHTGGFLGPWTGFLLYTEGREERTFKTIGKMLEMEERIEKGQRWGRTLTVIQGGSAVRLSCLVAGPLHAEQFCWPRKNLIEKIKK